MTNYLMKMKDRQKVKIVSMDMWNPYRAAVKAVLPQARIVVDKFHVVRMANDALEKVRKGLRKELMPSQSRTLKGDRKILLKRAHEVSNRERLIMETWTGAFPQLLAAYEHKERFYGIWDATTRPQAEAALDEWIATIPKGQKEVWSDLVRAVGNWREEIMTYFETDMPVTNAYTESINRLAKDKNREGRGYSFEVSMTHASLLLLLMRSIPFSSRKAALLPVKRMTCCCYRKQNVHWRINPLRR